MSGKIGVIIIDDSAITRSVIARELAKAGDIEVLAMAADALTARDLIQEKRPHVITLDLELPRMDGLTFLRRVIKYMPIPVIVCSSLTPAGCSKAMECLEAGACEVIGKPRAGAIGEWGAQLIELVRGAARARVERRMPAPVIPVLKPATPTPAVTIPTNVDSRKIIAIGSSTGGTEALRSILAALPLETPAVLMTQHMPEGFTKPFADRLNGLSRMDVREATDGEAVRPGLALLAPAGKHLRLARENGRYVARLSEGPAVKRHRPSVEVLFESVAQSAGAHAMGVILTGMGDDGADGMLSMAKAGAFTVAQDEASCVVFGMPKAAIQKGGVQRVGSLDQIPSLIRDFTTGAHLMAA
ncbi:MAG: chemotaxis response regulator protein-glutamate methylesterase [Phycisphaerae bacterium]|jgi:two-component system chemotaxis response regulator CheB|nr:chemotaxis response regulator protein-glutamate methylesterase [Phycisphaerae bacterium]